MEDHELRADRLEAAIREHRASKTPRDWSDHDCALYTHLPEHKGADGDTPRRHIEHAVGKS